MDIFIKRLEEIKELNLSADKKFLLRVLAIIEDYKDKYDNDLTYEKMKEMLKNE